MSAQAMMDAGDSQRDGHARALSSDVAFALVLVTYGARLHLVDQSVRQALLHPSVKSVIIVDNNSSSPVDKLIIDSLDRDRVKVLTQKTNTGSAGGYHVGLKYARDLDNIDYIILLDDDLLIEQETISTLLQYISNTPNCDAVIVPRDDRPDQSASLEAGCAPAIRSDSFHDFHILNWRRSLHRRQPNQSLSRIPSEAVPVEYAPYAGMVLAKALVRRAELPDQDFYVYCDDYDYLIKLKIAGACPLLLNVAPLKSIDQSWNQKTSRAPAVFNTASPAFRVYYSLRNRVAYERRYIVSNYWIYTINMIAFLIAGNLLSFFDSGMQYSALRRLRLLATAIRDGWHGNLGRNDETVRRYS